MRGWPATRPIAPACGGGSRRWAPISTMGCIGSIGEIFDGEPPFSLRGCIAQAWSVAEVLRSWVRVADA